MAVASPTHAQSTAEIRLLITDSVISRPITAARILWSSTTNSRAGLVETDSTGVVVMKIPDGPLDFTIQKIGYVPRHFVGHIADGAFLVLKVLPLPTALPASVSTATETQSRVLTLSGFFERRHTMTGTFMDSAQIARQQSTSLLSLLRPYIKPCTMIFVDGLALMSLRDVDVTTVVGIEVYASNLEAPEKFWNRGESGVKRCGSIVVWRRT